MAEQVEEPNPWTGRELLDAHSHMIGTITGVAFPRRKFGTTWLLVETAAAEKIPVPVVEIRSVGERLVLPYPLSYIESGPTIRQDQPLSKAEMRRLSLHYGFSDSMPGARSCCRTCGLCYAAKRAERLKQD